ncbi:MAG: class I SAM-dependent methyltransferase [Deltaproteobacteria bacterium]|nr:class I SAM-dependent methyltransferase [Deltaproteobacteria bacterium]
MMPDVKMNPWMKIPLSDYEGHMSMTTVGQAQMLSDIFADMLNRYLPDSVAMLGCSGGNGFDHTRRSSVTRVVGIDINPEYIERTRTRYGRSVPSLELFCGDIESDAFAFKPVDLVFAGLVFEYVEGRKVLCRIRNMMNPGGVLVAILQLPATDMGKITPSPYKSLELLETSMSLVEPEKFIKLAESCGFYRDEAQIRNSIGRKEFLIIHFHLESAESGSQGS